MKLTLKAGAGSTKIPLADALTFIGAEAITAGEKHGEMKTVGPWDIVRSYKALCTTATWTDRPGAPYVDTYTLHGDRTLSNPRQGGYELEGHVSIDGVKRSAFTSSIMFEIQETGQLVNVAVIHARTKS